MVKYHNTLSRRQFMKGLGLAGAGLGVAAGVATPFQDIDELTSSAIDPNKQPWWIKKMDIGKPTTDIDWNKMQRFDKRPMGQAIPFVAPENIGKMMAQNEEVRQKALANQPGFTRRDWALQASAIFGEEIGLSSAGKFLHTTYSSAMPLGDHTDPKDKGLPPWQGTEEENLQTMLAAVRHFGGSEIGVTELTEQTRKLIFANDGQHDIVFRDVDEPEETATTKVIPNRFRWVLSYSIVQSHELNKRVGTQLGTATFAHAYSRAAVTQAHVQNFLGNLGYRGIGSHPGAITGFGTLSGLGELGRMGVLISPKHGALVRMPMMLITDFPMAPTNPIDAGIEKFCAGCLKCSDNCPSGSISTEDASWESGSGPWNNPGIKSWKTNFNTCFDYWITGPAAGCGICQGICMFNKYDIASVHSLIKVVVANSSMFTSFFRDMDDAFGYGLTSEYEQWWDLDLPLYGQEI
jgi:reductive dehalogenase